MRTELISIATPTHPLDGAYYTPDGPIMDRLTNVPDLIENAKRIQCPVLFIRGDQEPPQNYPAEAFKENCAGPCDVAIVPNCDHFYVGAEERVTKIVTDWLARTLSD